MLGFKKHAFFSHFNEGHSLKNVEISPVFLVRACWRVWLRCEPELGGCSHPSSFLEALGPLAPSCMGCGAVVWGRAVWRGRWKPGVLSGKPFLEARRREEAHRPQ